MRFSRRNSGLFVPDDEIIPPGVCNLLAAGQLAGFGGKSNVGIGNRFPGNSGISFSGLVSGGNSTTFSNLLDGSTTTFVGDTNSGDNNDIVVTIYGLNQTIRFNVIGVYASSTSPGGSSGGRWTQCVVEGSQDTTTGSDGTWTNIGWADGSTNKDLCGVTPPSGPPIFDAWNYFAFNIVAPQKGYRFRQTTVSQFVAINEIELIAA